MIYLFVQGNVCLRTIIIRQHAKNEAHSAHVKEESIKDIQHDREKVVLAWSKHGWIKPKETEEEKENQRKPKENEGN